MRLDDFELHRQLLFGIAYRMLGSATEAEDLLQEMWIRWQGYDVSTVDNPTAFLATMTTRSAINEAYVSVKTGHDQMRDLKHSLHASH